MQDLLQLYITILVCIRMYIPYRYIDNIEQSYVLLCNIRTTRVLDVDFSHASSGKYYICEATVGGA